MLISRRECFSGLFEFMIRKIKKFLNFDRGIFFLVIFFKKFKK